MSSFEPIDPNEPSQLAPLPEPPAYAYGYGYGYGNPGYPQSYPAQSYPAQSYPAQSYPPQTYYPQPYYPPPGYPQPYYPPSSYPQPYYPQTSYDAFELSPPGPAMAASVLGYVVSGLLLLTAFGMLIGTLVASGVDGDDPNAGALVLAGIANIAAAAFIISGGVSLVSRNHRGRTFLTVGASIDFVAGVIWLSNGAEALFGCLLFVVPMVVGLALAWQRSVTLWLGPVKRAG